MKNYRSEKARRTEQRLQSDPAQDRKISLQRHRELSGAEPLLVRPRKAWAMLGCGHCHGYELLERGEIDSFVDGSARWITVASIHSYIARHLAKPKTKITKSPQRARLENQP